ncbi:LytR/AlgR family response regulator transcription factor [Urechidicola croceus]|uniref:DNA-binding response regulator n=1 Tax=Urechidicola croceus TaxID=1850246 RepID=A0A1D8P5D7_9FLAO|nr:LytTR family DNA-binding domain-containing protein [Urechidicola croceus]AOW19789.1 hypothetical protein LPB138_03410 [Urechidicola croceus]
MKCLIVDDDPLICDLLFFFCEKIQEITSVTKTESGFEAVNLISETNYDIIFLDFNLPDITGKELLNIISQSTAVVMVTSHKEFALDSYNYNQIVDYLVKPIDFSLFFRGFQKAKSFNENNKQTSSAKIFIKDSNKFVHIDLTEVHFFKSEGNYISVVFENKKILTLMSMKDLELKLPQQFQRVHRSYIINLNAIDVIDSNSIKIGQNEIPISQSYEKVLHQKIHFLN